MVAKIYSRFLNMIKNFRIVYKDKDRKGMYRIIREFFIASFKSKCIATYYFTSLSYKKSITNYLDFISHKEWKFMQREICDSTTYVILGDKLYSHFYFEKFKIPMPPLLAYSIREKFIVKDSGNWKIHEITTVESCHNIVKSLLEKSTYNTIFIKKAVSSGGEGVAKLDWHKSGLCHEKINAFFKDFLLGAYIFQDEVKSHPDLAKFNPGTLNSSRMDTFKASGKKAEVMSAFFRIGGISAIVDNATSGGCFIGIDLKLGRLKNRGTYKLAYGGSFTNHHLETGIKFEGFPIPFFEEVKLLAIEAANCLPQSLVGWDIAVSNNGPVLLEGNTVYYAMATCDIAYGGYRKNPVYNKVTDYVKNVLKK